MFIMAVVLNTCVFLHRYLAAYAPSNLLVRRVRSASASVRTATVLFLTSVLLMWIAGASTRWVNEGESSWLLLLSFVAAWDALKLAALGVQTSLRWLGTVAGRGPITNSARRAIPDSRGVAPSALEVAPSLREPSTHRTTVLARDTAAQAAMG